MGYYTYFNLDIYKDERKKDKKKWSSDLKELDPYGEEEWGDEPIAVLRGFSEDAAWALNEEGGGVEGCKWYDHDQDLIRLSKMFPDIVFRLYGEGEEKDDVWYEYYKDGKIQTCRARITFDSYDEDKLENYKDPYEKYKIKRLK